MIDVPIQVKDALREGRLRKNYRFEVQKEVDQKSAVNLATLTSSNSSYTTLASGSFIIYNLSNPHAFNYYEIVGASSSAGVCPVGETETWVEVTCDAGDTITIYGFYADEIYITQPSLVTHTNAWEYDFTIDNNNLVSESVSFDERMCSGDIIKYGLCEGSSLDFQYFDKANIKGRQIKAFIDVNYGEEERYYKSLTTSSLTCTIDAYGKYQLYTLHPNSVEVQLRRGTDIVKTYEFSSDPGGNVIIDYLIEGDRLSFVGNSGSVAIYQYTQLSETIPMGVFTAEKVSRQASTGIMKVTAYNKLMSQYLDAKANQLIIDSFDNPNMPVAFYDIRNVLLDGYEIEKEDYEEVRVGLETGFVGSVRKLSGGSISLKARYGINSPINYYEYNGMTSTSTTAYLYVVAAEASATLDPTKVYTIKSDYDIKALEQHYYDTISDLLSLSFNVSGNYMSRFINPQTGSSSAYDSYLGWHNYFGVCVEKTGGVKEWYSTIAYNAGLTNVVGTFKDLTNITLENCTKITFYTPYEILLSSSSSTPDGSAYMWYKFFCTRQLSVPIPNDYKYYADSSLTLADGTYLFTDTKGVAIAYEDTYGAYWAKLFRYSNISQADLIKVIPSLLSDVTLREAISASYETVCQFGQLNRETDLFSGVELNRSRLLPADTLYPDNALYPDGAQESAFRSQYSKLWADEGNVHKWRYLIITYKGLDGEGNEQDYTLQRTVNNDGTDNYNCSDNWLFRNLIWTAEQIGEYADAMVLKMRDITWFPFEMWCAGLPYLETGDEIEIPLGEETYTSYILQRQLKGIQNLQDTYINGTLDIF